MREIRIVSGNPYIIEKVEPEIPIFTRSDYGDRIAMLIDRMKAADLTHAIIYADREHFSNMEYLTGYDPRFEEALLIISRDGELTLLVGNEGFAYSFITPLDVKRVLYQNFSLQGQLRENLKSLKEIFEESKIKNNSKIGIIGFKYFEPGHIKDHIHMSDIPSYIIDEISEIAERDRIINFTRVMTDPADGIRMVIRNPKEIAYYEYVANKASNCIINTLNELKPGIKELDASRNAGYDAWPISVFPIINFGEEHVKLGLRSPNHRQLNEGDMITLCYGLRGALVARSGLAVSDGNNIPHHLRNAIDDFYKPFFMAMVTWYESIDVGSSCGEVYDKVMEIIGDKDKFGVGLNPGHNIGADEWTNSPFFKNSKYKVQNGYYLQADIIASSHNPFKQAILEDGIVVADESLRMKLKEQYPDVYDRIEKRRNLMKNILGINIGDNVLPLSNAQAVMHPYMLNTEKFFSILA